MKNTLQFWVLQQLYVILSLADVREIGDLVLLNKAFSILHPEVEKKEAEQNELRKEVEPYVHQNGALHQQAAERRGQGKKDDDIVDRMAKNDIKLQEYDQKLREFQDTVVDFEWPEEVLEPIREIVTEVLKTNGTQSKELTGYRRISAAAKIIEAFDIKDTSL